MKLHIMFATFNKETVIVKRHTFQLAGIEKKMCIIFKMHGKICHKLVVLCRERYNQKHFETVAIMGPRP